MDNNQSKGKGIIAVFSENILPELSTPRNVKILLTVIAVLLACVIALGASLCSVCSAEATKQNNYTVGDYLEDLYGIEDTDSDDKTYDNGVYKTGTVNSHTIDTGNALISVVDWGWKRSTQNMYGEWDDSLNELCIRFHITNKTDKTMQIMDLIQFTVFANGVDGPDFFKDFYGNGLTDSIMDSSDLKPGAETDYYYCTSFAAADSILVEIDVNEASIYDEKSGFYLPNENIVDTFSFTVQ